MMTTDRRRSRAPLRRSSTPERILSAGLATATCVGVVGLLGARTIEANASSASEVGTEQAEITPVSDSVAPSGAAGPTTSSGLTQADLDAYAADLAKEKERLDAYRAKLVKAAKKLTRQLAAGNAAPAAGTTSAETVVPSRPTGRQPAPAAKSKPRPVAAPAPVSPPAPKPAAKPQSTTKGS